MSLRGGKNIFFRKGGGRNVIFGPKYRPLAKETSSRIYLGNNEMNSDNIRMESTQWQCYMGMVKEVN
jgi:hypothetical protein